MDIVKLSDTAKSVLNGKDYNVLMAHINNRKMSDARVFIEDKVDELIFSTELTSMDYRHEKLLKLRQIDAIITNQIISKLEINGATTVSV